MPLRKTIGPHYSNRGCRQDPSPMGALRRRIGHSSASAWVVARRRVLDVVGDRCPTSEGVEHPSRRRRRLCLGVLVGAAFLWARFGLGVSWWGRAGACLVFRGRGRPGSLLVLGMRLVGSAAGGIRPTGLRCSAPKGLRLSAQGCDGVATLGPRQPNTIHPNGVAARSATKDTAPSGLE